MRENKEDGAKILLNIDQVLNLEELTAVKKTAEPFNRTFVIKRR